MVCHAVGCKNNHAQDQAAFHVTMSETEALVASVDFDECESEIGVPGDISDSCNVQELVKNHDFWTSPDEYARRPSVNSLRILHFCRLWIMQFSGLLERSLTPSRISSISSAP